MKHTPGPWTAKPTQEGDWQIDTGPDQDLNLTLWSAMAVIHGCDGDPELGLKKAEANARLMAAAPDLLEALEELFHLIDDAYDGERLFTLNLQRKVRAAIAKAKGTTP